MHRPARFLVGRGGGRRPKLPAVERFIYLPDPGEQGLAHGVISNQYDFTTGIQPTTFPTVFDGNPKVTTWTGQDAPYGNVDWWPHSLYLNNERPPFDDPDVRWAISYYIDRDQIIDVGWSGASSPSTPLSLPDYPGLKPFLDAAKPLIEQYPYLSSTRDKGDALLTKQGWKKDSDGMWQDADGKPVHAGDHQLLRLHRRRAGRGRAAEARRHRRDLLPSRRTCSTASARATTPAALRPRRQLQRRRRTTRCASTRRPEKIPGGHLVNFSRWHNADYDKLVDELYSISPTDTAKVMDIWQKCLAIWLPGYPDIQLTAGLSPPADEPDLLDGLADQGESVRQPGAWHLTWSLVMHELKPAAVVRRSATRLNLDRESGVMRLALPDSPITAERAQGGPW